MLHRAQGKLAFATLRDGSGGECSCSRWPPSPTTSRGSAAISLGDWVGATGEVVKTKRGELSVKVVVLGDARRDPAQLRRQVARHQRRRHALPPALRRPLGQPRERATTFLQRSRIMSLTRRWLEDRELHRGGDAGLPPDPRRRAGQAVHHAPQRARHGAVPAHRARALPEAPHRRRLRAGVRDRPRVPQRGPLDAPQPRVHDARALPGLRRLPRRDGAHRGARRPPRDGAARHHQLTYGGRELDLTPPWRRATLTELVEEHAGVHVDVRMPVDDLRRIAERARRRGEGRLRPRQARARDLREDHRGRALGPGVRHRLPEGGLAARARPPRAAGHGRALRGRSSPAASCATPSPSSSIPTSSAPASRTRRSRRPPATTRRWSSTRTTCGRSSTACRPPPASASAWTAW